jgi:hypothetical protein
LVHCDKARSDFGNSGSLLSVNDAVMSWLTPLIASHIHMGHVSSVLAPFNDVHGHISASLLCYYTNEARSHFGISGSLSNVKIKML